MDNYNLRIVSIINKFGRLILRNPNIIGVGRGNKRINGCEINRPSLVIYIKNKLPNDAISNLYRIPKVLGGVATDVVESNDFEFQREDNIKNNYSKFTSNEDKVAMGGGCLYLLRKSPSGEFKVVNRATVTFPVMKIDDPESIYLLTNGSFLIYENKFSIEDKVYYSKRNDNISEKNSWEIGNVDYLYKSGQFFTSEVQIDIDAGLIKVPRNLRNLIKPQLTNGLAIKATENIPNNTKYQYTYNKCGAGTGCTKGKIRTVNTIMVHYKEKQKFIYLNQMVVENASDNIDIGALAVNVETDRAVGMLNGSMGIKEGSAIIKCSYYSSIKSVLSELKLDFMK